MGKRVRSRDGANFVAPPMPAYPFEQGFGLEVHVDGAERFHRLDYTGFEDISFLGQYPVGTVTYRDAAVPVEVTLNAFSPFVPLDLDASSYPATVMAFTLKNPSDSTVDVTLSGWLENPVCLFTGSEVTVRHVNRVDRRTDLTMLTCSAERTSPNGLDVADQTDSGSMALAVLASENVQATPQVDLKPAPHFDSEGAEARAPFGRRLTGALGVPVTLAQGAEQTVTFVVAWHFPNLTLKTNKDDDQVADWESSAFDGRHYRTRFADAAAVAEDIADKYEPLRDLTFCWRDLYYNASTLPHWLLNRTLWNVSTLATETCYRLGDGRFWAWEGVGCCEGTCTHVWHYAQAHARLFPEIEKILRAKTDFVAPAFNECMSGFEYQVAGHMLWEGMPLEGLAVTRAIHDRYHPSKRNPYNEIECSDHYARAMASYGVYLAVCGYAYDGPAGFLAFAPTIRPEDFKAAFTAAEGWGTLEQQQDGRRQLAAVELSYGQLGLRTLGFKPLDGVLTENVRVELNGDSIAASHALEGNRLVVHLQSEQVLQSGDRLSVQVG